MHFSLGVGAFHRIAPELKERAIMHLMPPYNWSLRQVGDFKLLLCHRRSDIVRMIVPRLGDPLKVIFLNKAH